MLDALTDTEKELVLKTARDYRRNKIRDEEDINDYFLESKPRWDYNDTDHCQLLRQYREWVAFGLENGIPKPVNWGSLFAIKQNPMETPSQFLDRLWEAMRKYTTLDLSRDQGKMQLVSLFLGQSLDDIRRKLQRLKAEEQRDIYRKVIGRSLARISKLEWD